MKIDFKYPRDIFEKSDKKIVHIFSAETIRRWLDNEECEDQVEALCHFGNLEYQDCSKKKAFGIDALNGIQMACQDYYFQSPNFQSGNDKIMFSNLKLKLKLRVGNSVFKQRILWM